MPRRKPIDRLREICLALPEATAQLARGEPTFRVGGKMFVMFSNNHHNDGRVAAWCNAAPGTQDLLVRSDPEQFFVPPYQGTRGWVGVRVEAERVDWARVTEIVEEAYSMVAPKRLLALLDGADNR